MSVVSGIVAVVVFVLAAMWLIVGILSLTDKLPGNRWFGVRSAETVFSEEAFRLANRVAGPGLIGAAGILTLGGILTIGLDESWSIVFGLVALVAGLLIVGTVSNIGIRAAAALTSDDAESAGGCGCCGDDHGAVAGDAGSCGTLGDSDDAAAAVADCGQSSCGACALRGMCESEPATPGA